MTTITTERLQELITNGIFDYIEKTGQNTVSAWYKDELKHTYTITNEKKSTKTLIASLPSDTCLTSNSVERWQQNDLNEYNENNNETVYPSWLTLIGMQENGYNLYTLTESQGLAWLIEMLPSTTK